MIPSEIQLAYDLAVVGLHRAYAPYSNFRVGAAIKIKESSEVIYACNVENISWGATICAERNAINQAVARFAVATPKLERNKIAKLSDVPRPMTIEYVVVIADTPTPTMPCGMCLQCLNEFSLPDTKIYVGNLEKIFGQFTMKDLLPNPYQTI
jgi:homotetrameric cytidine deaminase